MILQNKQITLRAIEEEDAPVLLSLINDPDIEHAVVGWSYPISLSQQKKWIATLDSNGSTVRFAIDAGNGIVGVAILSSVDLKNRTANMNIKLAKEAQGHGYATQAMELLIGYCFEELNLYCLTANVLAYNKASQKLWEKLGFRLDGVLRSRVFKANAYHNLFAYSLLKDEYYARNRQ